MKNVKTLINIFLLNINLLSYTFSSYLIFPFKTKKSIIEDTEHNKTRLFSSLLPNNIYINLEISEPKQKVEIMLNFFFQKKLKIIQGLMLQTHKLMM